MGHNTTTECLLFPEIFSKPVVVRFDQRQGSSDGGAFLLKAGDRRLGLTEALAACLTDRRQASKVEHAVEELLAQRIYGIACGYADANDAARLAADPVHKLLVGRDPVEGADLASQPTLCRFENAPDRKQLYRLSEALAERVIQRHRCRLHGRARRITIDLDPTDDPTHGVQQLSFFNSHYDTWCYLPAAAFVTFDEEKEQYLVHRSPTIAPAAYVFAALSVPLVARSAACDPCPRPILEPVAGLDAILALMKMGPDAKEALPALAAVLQNPDANVRLDAVGALGQIGPGSYEAVKAVAAELRDPVPSVRAQAAGALGLMTPAAEGALTALTTALQDANVSVRDSAAISLWRFGPAARAAIPALIVNLKNPDASLRANVALALGGIGPGRGVVPTLIAALRDPQQRVRASAAEALMTIADGARDKMQIGMIEQLEPAAQALAASGFGSASLNVWTAVDILKEIQPPWYQRLLAGLGKHPAAVFAIVLYSVLFIVSWILLLIYPLGLMRLSQAVERISTAPKVNLALGMGEMLFVFGLFRYHSRVLDAWISEYIGLARDQFNKLPTVEERSVQVVEMPVELDEKLLIPGLKPGDLAQAFSRNRTCLLIWGEGGSGKTSLAGC